MTVYQGICIGGPLDGQKTSQPCSNFNVYKPVDFSKDTTGNGHMATTLNQTVVAYRHFSVTGDEVLHKGFWIAYGPGPGTLAKLPHAALTRGFEILLEAYEEKKANG